MEIHRKLQTEKELEFFVQFEGVVFGVLKRLTIHPLNPHYDDFTQIGRLKLVEAYEMYRDDPFIEDNRGRFVGYAFTKIRWAIIDEIRKQSLRQEREQVWDESFDHTLPASDEEILEFILENEWLQEVLDPLTEKERQLVIVLCISNMTITAIAKKERVSRKTIYQRRNKIKEKLQSTLYPQKGLIK